MALSFLLTSVNIFAASALLLGPTYPAPRDLTSNDSLVALTWTNLSATLESIVTSPSDPALAQLAGLENITFSMGMFSVHDPLAAEALQFHYTSPEVSNSTQGLQEVDGNSIYRVASITKLVTVLAGMLEMKPEDWERSLGEIFPELAHTSGSENETSVTATNWSTITLTALAAQIGGVAHDGSAYSPGDILYLYEAAKASGAEEDALDPATLGLPPLNANDTPLAEACGVTSDQDCLDLGTAYLLATRSQPPAFRPWYGPGYSNHGFILLGLAMANITGRSIEEIYRDNVFLPLGMANSTSIVPDEAEFGHFVIPGGPTLAGFVQSASLSITTSSGGVHSTINDLAKFGIGILNSTLMDTAQTRRWMKPVSHTASLEHAVGRPWEIYRYTNPASGKVTDLYTKQGDSGLFVSYIILIPDYDVGFSILTGSASSERSVLVPILADLVTESLLPALESQASLEAARNFAGRYESTMESLNSSLTLSVNQSDSAAPGLNVASWISNGTDLTPLLSSVLGSPEARLVMTVPESGDQQVAFRASVQNDLRDHSPSVGLFYGQYTRNIDWLVVDAPTYGGVGLSLLVFDVDETGRAVSVTPAAFRTTLERTE